MERELQEEIGIWAGEVGNLVAMGLGESLTPLSSRQQSVTEIGVKVDDDDPDERLSFADIASTVAVQR